MFLGAVAKLHWLSTFSIGSVWMPNRWGKWLAWVLKLIPWRKLGVFYYFLKGNFCMSLDHPECLVSGEKVSFSFYYRNTICAMILTYLDMESLPLLAVVIIKRWCTFNISPSRAPRKAPSRAPSWCGGCIMICLVIIIHIIHLYWWNFKLWVLGKVQNFEKFRENMFLE